MSEFPSTDKRALNSRFYRTVIIACLPLALFLSGCQNTAEQTFEERKSQVLNTDGLIAFWDFEPEPEGPMVNLAESEHSYPIYFKQIGNQQNYTAANWPYRDSLSAMVRDHSGPFGQAVKFNQGHIYGAIPRDSFDTSRLNIHGDQSFTLLAWTKFSGARHMVAGIWDEGGWHKYLGRRQIALFAGLFNQKGVIAHVSQTGAASYPQSQIAGAQYARIRAIDAAPFDNEDWVCMAMSYDGEHNLVFAYLNGRATKLALSDPVTKDVFKFDSVQGANPLVFEGPIFSPDHFTIKYFGYDLTLSKVKEHSLTIDLEQQKIQYHWLPHQDRSDSIDLYFDVRRRDSSILRRPLHILRADTTWYAFEHLGELRYGDTIVTHLSLMEDQEWKIVGDTIKRVYEEGAPFTFGRALGLASEEMQHGSQLYLDGVAVFDRVLSGEEIEKINFVKD